MNVRTIMILLGKEYTLLFRNRIFTMFSIVLLFVLVGVYYVLPSQFESKKPSIAVYAEVDAGVFFHAWDEGAEAVGYVKTSSRDELLEAVQNGDHMAGIVITKEMWQDIEDGRQAEVVLYAGPGLADEHVRSLAFILEIVFSEMVYRTRDTEVRIVTEEIFVGEDILENAVPFKRQMIPLLVCMLLVMEVFSLGISLVEEKAGRSISAVLSAPVGMGEFLLAKNIAGISVISIQILVFMVAVGAIGPHFPVVILTILAGAVFTTGVSVLLAAFSTDMMSLVSRGVFAMIIMIVPLFGILFPGMLSSWMRVIPTYMLADAMNHLVNRGGAFRDVFVQLGALYAFAAAVLFAGLFFIRRRLECQ